MLTTDLVCEQFYTFLLAEKRVAHNTFCAYKQDVDQLVAFLNEKEVSFGNITKRNLVSFLKFLKDQGLGAKTLSRKLSTVKLLFTFLATRYDVPNCAKSVAFPKVEKNLPVYLTEQEIEKLLAAANRDNSDRGIRNKVMLYLLYATGMRVSELVCITVEQIQFDTGFLCVVGKGGKERMVPLPKNILELLRFYLETIYPKLLVGNDKKITTPTKKNFLFAALYNNTIKPLSRQTLWLCLKKILSNAAIFKNVSPHNLRHSLATHLLNQGIDLRSLQMILGHENLSTVQIYTHVTSSGIRKIYDKKHPRA